MRVGIDAPDQGKKEMELMPFWKSIIWVVAISSAASLLEPCIGCLVSGARKPMAIGSVHITAERASVAVGVLLATVVASHLVDYYFVRLAAPIFHTRRQNRVLVIGVLIIKQFS